MYTGESVPISFIVALPVVTYVFTETNSETGERAQMGGVEVGDVAGGRGRRTAVEPDGPVRRASRVVVR